MRVSMLRAVVEGCNSLRVLVKTSRGRELEATVADGAYPLRVVNTA